MTFEELIIIEPRLGRLRDDFINRIQGIPKRWTRSGIWYKEFKPRMFGLVGVGAENPELKSCEVYDLVYEIFIDAIDAKQRRK